MAIARDPLDLRQLSGADMKSAPETSTALLLLEFSEPRRQRVGAQSAVPKALWDLPFYVLADGLHGAKAQLIDYYASPFDRLLSSKSWRPDGNHFPLEALTISHSDRRTLLQSVFDHLDQTSRPRGLSENTIQKWNFLAAKWTLRQRLQRLARLRLDGTEPLFLMHYRSGDGSMASYMPSGIRYMGVDPDGSYPGGLPEKSSQQPVATVSEYTANTPADVFLFSGLDDQTTETELNAMATLVRNARLPATVFFLLEAQGDDLVGTSVSSQRGLGLLSAKVASAMGAHCELRHVAAISPKPKDLFPQKILAEFEIVR
ncbi:MAG: hypothetical protein AAGB11_08420 [Pseudomonadota bacterium]